MDTMIVLVYCLCDDLLKEMQHREDPQCQVSDAEVMTIGLVAALYFSGNQALCNTVLCEQGYLRYPLSRSRLCRRLARVSPYYEALFGRLGAYIKQQNRDQLYVVDSMPIPVCDGARIRTCRIYPVAKHPSRSKNQKGRRSKGGEYLGYIASKRRYYYGIKLNLLVTGQGEPVECVLTPARYNDVTCLPWFAFDLPPAATVYADKGYVSAAFADECAAYGIDFAPLHRTTDAQQDPGWRRYLNLVRRKAIERTYSLIERILPRHIHAVTARGFETKVALFVIATAISFLVP
jgi:hypothetical protein